MVESAAQRFAKITSAERPKDNRILMERAVVLGASMAGLMAARVLSDHADEVLIVERDTTGDSTEPRPGVPQGSQVHALLPAGQAQLDRWFPGFTREALDAGATNPPPEESRNYVNGVRRPLPPPGSVGSALVSTRPFLESMVRRRTLEIGNIRLVHGRADGIDITGDRITAARYQPEGTSGPESVVTVPADLVVDATGRSSRLSDWLGAAGWPQPPMQRMPIKLNYASALFRRDPKISDIGVSIASNQPGSGRPLRQGGILAVEGERWLVLVAGYADDRPTRDIEDFRQRCRNDYPPDFAEIADHGELLGEVITYHQADSRRRDYHLLDRIPAGLIVAGDAVASFNPIYGQGMTSATLHASCLSAYLRSNPPLEYAARSYFNDVSVVVDVAWQLSTAADLSLPHVDGPYPRGYRLTKWISAMIYDATAKDQTLNAQFNRVVTMLDHPSKLAGPQNLLRALRYKLLPGTT
ncbi:FAD-dependent oxidoreductase [Kribbella sandramycini]|uniref:FAD-dependent oxidoreductase n=1 Tax=Kribbella sandramycini TaxID=60450 RepID=A0A7Y4KZ97_9ACTN|nr:FAD-dependent oxidoreductase [Kribbella sandramycini]MBB6565141.1 2-polyprenyl-6-methoxyphenol hydroxylase-like FAD-dependent oxidoreductase [Kribbella sandramycini]NOL41410.1 FAD-dependent oxidoreductase [Kribbella sandramycini]